MEKKCEASICVFLALTILLIMSLILVFLENARRSASESYARILLKTATESVLGDYCGPLFADYDVFAVDSGFGSKTGDTDELERKIKKYMGENIWGFENEEVKVTYVRKLMEESGSEFISQAAAFEKYAAVEDVLDEVIGRVKNLADQNTIMKVMEKKLGIEDELSIIDKYTLELMSLIDGVNMTLGTRTSSLLGYSVSDNFIKRFYVKDVSMEGAMINNPSVYDRLKGKYVNPLNLIDEYRAILEKHRTSLKEMEELNEELMRAEEKVASAQRSIEVKENELAELEKRIEDIHEKIGKYEDDLSKAEDIKDDKRREREIKRLNSLIERYEEQIERLVSREESIIEKIDKLVEKEQKAYAELEKIREEQAEANAVLDEELMKILELEEKLEMLHTSTVYNLERVCGIVDSIAAKQAVVRPMVEEFEDVMKVFGPVLSDEITDSLKDSLDYMRAYVGMGNGKIKTTDFDSIKRTAEFDISIMNSVDTEAFALLNEDCISEVEDRLKRLNGIKEKYRGFSYSGFSFDYSEIKESSLKNTLIAEFENNVSDGYLSLFLDDTSDLSSNVLRSELLPSEWYEVFQSEVDDDPGKITEGAEKGSEGLSEADESSGLSDLADIFEEGLSAVGEKLLSAMYMRHHFKSFKNRTVTGDTVLDYEVEYILSGFETDKANLSAAATKIMLLRLVACIAYTMTDKSMKAQAQVLATTIMGFTGLPFLVALVKYLILFLWAAAQAVVETAAIMRGKKVPVITNDESFCISLAELPVFASLVSEKADHFSESQIYLDYDDYMMVFLLLQGERTQAARAMDVIQENIRYKYDEDFLMSNAITAFSCDAVFSAASKYLILPLIDGHDADYRINVCDTVSY